MEVKKAEVFGKGLEVICRYKAVGSFFKRYGKYVKEGQNLDAYVEITIKDDDAGDPLITKEALLELGILKEGEYETLIEMTKKICGIVKDILAERVDTVIVAIGTLPNPLIKSTTRGLDVNRWGCIVADETGKTSREGVYAGGDTVTGAATVINAMGAGKIAAASIDRYIQSKS